MNKVEYLLTCLSEECAEIQKAAAKAMRFGLENGSPFTDTTNAQDIVMEVYDLLGVLELLAEQGAIVGVNKSIGALQIMQKKEKVMSYYKKAIEWGAVTENNDGDA